MKLAKELEAADEYIELDRENPQSQWDKLKQDYPHGFDVVVSTSSSLSHQTHLIKPYNSPQISIDSSHDPVSERIGRSNGR